MSEFLHKAGMDCLRRGLEILCGDSEDRRQGAQHLMRACMLLAESGETVSRETMAAMLEGCARDLRRG